jgi:hypothetical protein
MSVLTDINFRLTFKPYLMGARGNLCANDNVCLGNSIPQYDYPDLPRYGFRWSATEKMALKLVDDLEHFARQRADLKQRLDRFEAGDTGGIVTDAQRQAAAQYMRRAIADFDALIRDAKKKSKRKDKIIHLF